jgi:hypothetical protein
MWVDSKSQAPVRYEMLGYDTLLGSHYDKYYLDYSNYKAGPVNATAFNYSSYGKELVMSTPRHLITHLTVRNRPCQHHCI